MDNHIPNPPRGPGEKVHSLKIQFSTVDIGHRAHLIFTIKSGVSNTTLLHVESWMNTLKKEDPPASEALTQVGNNYVHI